MSNPDLVERMRAGLTAALSPEFTENLMPHLRLRITGGRLYVVLPNRIWIDAFRSGAQEEAERIATSIGLTMSVAARDDAHAPEQRTFEAFAEDPGNQLALAACRRACREPGQAHNPLYIYGPPGSGKSHLVSAMMHELNAAAGDDGSVLFSGDEFVARWAQALAGRDTHQLKETVQSAIIIACDGIEALAGRQLAQEQFFLLLNEAKERGQQVVVTGRLPPHQLSGFEERLTTRLSWGLSVVVELPLLETRLAVLRRLSAVAAERDPGELARLVESFAPDMHGIGELASRLDLGETPGNGPDEASFDRILQAVADHYGVRAGDITGSGRVRHIARARQAALLLGRRLTGHSLEALGGMVGGRDHSTVLYSIRQAEIRLDEDATFAKEFADLTRAVLTQK
ncbi:MAG: DnaA/Hda family protein [Planctomycetota bacterium]